LQDMTPFSPVMGVTHIPHSHISLYTIFFC
jgi:hypothetical protein